MFYLLAEFRNEIEKGEKVFLFMQIYFQYYFFKTFLGILKRKI